MPYWNVKYLPLSLTGVIVLSRIVRFLFKPMRMLRERWIVARSVRAIRKASRRSSKQDGSKPLERLILLNSRRGNEAIQMLSKDETTRRVVHSYAPSFDGSDAEFATLAAILRSRQLPLFFRKAIIRRLATRFALRPDVQQLLVELIRPDQPDHTDVIIELTQNVNNAWYDSPETGVWTVRTLVKVAPDAAPVQEIFKGFPTHMDSQLESKLSLCCELIRDEANPLPIREAILRGLYSRLYQHATLRGLCDEVLTTGTEAMAVNVLELMLKWHVVLSPSVVPRVAQWLSHSDPAMRVRAAKGLAKSGDKRGADYLLSLPNPGIDILSHLGKVADRRCIQPAWKAFQKSEIVRDKSSALSLIEQCLIRDPEGFPQPILDAILRLPAQLTESWTREIQPMSDEDRRNWYYMHENSPGSIPPPTEVTYEHGTTVVRDNANLLKLAKAEDDRRGTMKSTQVKKKNA